MLWVTQEDPMSTHMTQLIALLAALAVVGAGWFFGGSVPAALLLVAVIVGLGLMRAVGESASRATKLLVVFAVLGGLVAVPSAVQALATVGGLPVYETRVGFGWLALALALVASVAPIALRERPGLAATIVSVSGLAGSIAINFFWINTVYTLALPLWLIGTLIALSTMGTRSVPVEQA
jgi:hypothetical protein